MLQAIKNHTTPTMPAFNMEKLDTSPKTVPNKGLMLILLILTPVWISPYLMMMYSTLNKIELAPFRLIWLHSLLMRNSASHKKWVVRIFPMLD
jgi:hypothetical protein